MRALRVLKEVDYIAAEDTRHTLKLLNHYGIAKPLISYHQHNERTRSEELIALVKEGNRIALVSDSGMPGISDPGSKLTALAHERGVPVTIVPGPTAGISALVLSGMEASRFVFEGFIPRQKKDRNTRLEKLKEEERTIIFYEAPHRLVSTLEDLLKELGNRKIAVVRELTKIYEEVLLMDLHTALLHFREQPPRGEIVLILEGRKQDRGVEENWSISIQEHIKQYMEEGLNKKEAIRQVAEDRGMPKRQVYKHGIDIDKP